MNRQLNANASLRRRRCSGHATSCGEIETRGNSHSAVCLANKKAVHRCDVPISKANGRTGRSSTSIGTSHSLVRHMKCFTPAGIAPRLGRSCPVAWRAVCGGFAMAYAGGNQFHRTKRVRRGYLTIELIMVLFVLVLATFVTVQFGTALIVKQTVAEASTVAAREAAKGATLNELTCF